jgi:hypothetical protein
MLLLLVAWLAMQAVHELGHVVGAWLTGGAVKRVVLHPLKISRTDVSPNPRPLLVAWMGPIAGVILPALFAAMCRLIRKRSWRLEFFARFCLIANGAYIGVGSFEGIGDASDLLRHGAPRWTLLAFGIACSATGLLVWHYLTKRPVEPVPPVDV